MYGNPNWKKITTKSTLSVSPLQIHQMENESSWSINWLRYHAKPNCAARTFLLDPQGLRYSMRFAWTVHDQCENCQRGNAMSVILAQGPCMDMSSVLKLSDSAIFWTRVRVWQWDPLASLTIQVCLARSLWFRPRRVEVSEKHGKTSKDMSRTHGHGSPWAQLKKDCAWVNCDQINMNLIVFGHRANLA